MKIPYLFLLINQKFHHIIQRVIRITDNGDFRITDDGSNRITDDSST